MPKHEYRLVDVFTSDRFGGNPLAVFPDADGIDPADMQRIARVLNLSETTFVLPTEHPECDFRVRIFTPQAEMPMAGHPTVGTAWVLDRGNRVTFLEGVGPIAVDRVEGASGSPMWRMTQPLPTWGACIGGDVAASLLGLDTIDVEAKLPVQVVSSGAPFLFVPLRNLEALAKVRVHMERCALVPELTATYGMFCFTTRSGDSTVTVRSRMFAPTVGVAEDPATGGASGPLGCYLVRYGLVPPGTPARMLSLQGVEMGRPSRVHIEIEGTADAFTAVRILGECVAVGGGYIDL